MQLTWRQHENLYHELPLPILYSLLDEVNNLCIVENVHALQTFASPQLSLGNSNSFSYSLCIQLQPLT